LNPSPDADTPRLSFIERLCFGSGDFISNMLFGISGSFLVYFYTTVERIPPAQVAALMLIARIVHSLSDPVSGILIDRQTLFGGALRPYIRWFSPAFVLSSFLCFVPMAPGGGRMAWSYGTYLLSGVLFALVVNPYGLLPNVMTRAPRDRLSLATFRMFGGMLGVALVAAIGLPAVHWLGHGSEIAGFPRFMALVCVGAAIIYILPATGCQERFRLERPTQPIGTVLRALMRNRAWLVATFVLSAFYLNLTAFYGLAIYYARFVLGLPAAFGGVLLAMMAGGKVFGTLFAPTVVGRIGARAGIALPYLASASLLVCFALIGPHPIALAICFALVCFFEGLTLPVMYLWVSESIDYGSDRAQTSSAGLAYALNSFIGRVTWALGGALSSALLAWGGYDAATTVQTHATRTCITVGFLGVPFVVALVSSLAALAYPVRNDQPEAT